MVYKFRIISNESEEFVRDIEVLDSNTFMDFHLAIQKELEYDPGYMTSFFLSNESWEKQMEFTIMDMAGNGRTDLCTMEGSILGEFLKEPKQRLIYVFDQFSERALFIELEEIKEANPDMEYPSVTWSNGFPPEQIVLDAEIADLDFSDDILPDEGEDNFPFESLDDLEDI